MLQTLNNIEVLTKKCVWYRRINFLYQNYNSQIRGNHYSCSSFRCQGKSSCINKLVFFLMHQQELNKRPKIMTAFIKTL